MSIKFQLIFLSAVNSMFSVFVTRLVMKRLITLKADMIKRVYSVIIIIIILINWVKCGLGFPRTK